jgi:carboxyl-terminal processing protease
MDEYNNKQTGNSFKKGALFGALVMLIIVAGGFCVWNFAGAKFFASNGNTLDASSKRKIQIIETLIDQNYLYDVDTEDLTEGLYKGMTEGLDDVYSVYYDEDEAKALTESTSGEYDGIGAVMQQDPDTGIITISQVYEDSPAEEAGMEDGDILYKVEDEEVTGQDLSLVVTKVKGEGGTQVNLTLLRGDDQEQIDVSVTRRTIEAKTVESEMKDGKIGYIYISAFESVTADQFEEAFEDLKSQGMQGLVLDLRSNPGGNLDTVCEIADYLLPEGLIVYTVDKNDKKTEYSSDADTELDVPLTVLVNGGSASASEILTGAIQDYGVGTIVGTTTYGKGVVQNLYDLGDGTILKLTTSEYYTPNGRSINKKGIDPDVEIEYEKDENDPDHDNQLDKAIEVLKEKM